MRRLLLLRRRLVAIQNSVMRLRAPTPGGTNRRHDDVMMLLVELFVRRLVALAVATQCERPQDEEQDEAKNQENRKHPAKQERKDDGWDDEYDEQHQVAQQRTASKTASANCAALAWMLVLVLVRRVAHDDRVGRRWRRAMRKIALGNRVRVLGGGLRTHADALCVAAKQTSKIN
jgi:hypothetical protein